MAFGEPRPRQHTILYDSDCAFCKWSIDKILFWDNRGRLRALALQSDEAVELLAGTAEKDRLRSWHLVTPDRSVLSAGAAAGPLARLLPGGRPIAYLFELFPVATERAYRWVATNRARFGRMLQIDASCRDRFRT